MRALVASFAIVLVLWSLGSEPARAYSRQEEEELQIGASVYNQLEREGRIVTSSPLYERLEPLAQSIGPVANRRYFAPFRFIVIRGEQPNAFAVPGGNIYVTESMFSFVGNDHELGDVLCHETAHDIHHDVYDLYVKGQRVSLWATLAQLLLAQKSQVTAFAIDLLANVQMARFSRLVETRADESGAYICAEAGVNPWGMVTLMQRFIDHPSTQAPPEFLSDHPTDSHRISDLERLFAAHPETFAGFTRL